MSYIYETCNSTKSRIVLQNHVANVQKNQMSLTNGIMRLTTRISINMSSYCSDKNPWLPSSLISSVNWSSEVLLSTRDLDILSSFCLCKEILSQQRIRHFKILQSIYFAYDVGIISSYSNKILVKLIRNVLHIILCSRCCHLAS